MLDNFCLLCLLCLQPLFLSTDSWHQHLHLFRACHHLKLKPNHSEQLLSWRTCPSGCSSVSSPLPSTHLIDLPSPCQGSAFSHSLLSPPPWLHPLTEILLPLMSSFLLRTTHTFPLGHGQPCCPLFPLKHSLLLTSVTTLS